MGSRLTQPPAGSLWDIVFLDRDGTINERVPGYVDAPERLVLIPGAAEAIARVNAARIPVVIVTNQRGLATGRLSWGAWRAVDAELHRQLDAHGAVIDAVQLCPHDAGACRCRKPGTGLFEQALAAAPWARPARCLMIGDMPSDTAPARALGMHAVQLGVDAPSLAAALDGLLGG